ncbi:MAG: ATP-binding protein [Candidatus Cloacimonetes bacterium]|nr:ATP-binding protein [Candidatus Cloacimonadota bacterium]MCK9335008.1 ATP-binding protein [Candidatus Cloacimonadota bacterium]
MDEHDLTSPKQEPKIQLNERFDAAKRSMSDQILPQTPRFCMEHDVILDHDTKLRIEEAINKIKYHKTIYKEWGFGAVDPDGSGLSLNLYGRPGTGKTMTAEAIAGTLEQPFLNISLADLESKFMGETSKNIQTIFKTACDYQAVIFFDEADTLLGKRLASVTQGIDNEVNACRSTLLIELEKFEGVTIFATNFVENYDKAFQSRISYHIHIPMPNEDARKAIWRRFLIPTIPYQDDVDSIIELAANESDGFSGRDIRTAMRLALPKIFSHTTDTEHKGLSWELMEVAIAEVKKAQNEVGQYVNPRTKTSIENARSLMGIKEGE